jgi:hypothetical protein
MATQFSTRSIVRYARRDATTERSRRERSIETPEGKPYLPASRYLPANPHPPEIVPLGDGRRVDASNATRRCVRIILIDAFRARHGRGD